MSCIRYNNSGIEIVDANNNKQNKASGKKNDHTRGKANSKVVKIDVKPLDTDSSVNEPVAIAALGTGSVARIPVVLAQLTIQTNVNSVITLPEYAYEIKQIKKRVKVTQCLLIQDTNVLFIKGFIRKNIDYSTRDYSTAEGFSGDIKHITVDVPFSCTTPVDFNGIAPVPPVASSSTEFQYLKREDIKHPDFSEKDGLISGDLRENNQISTEYFNELPFCDLISTRIVEFDEQLMPVRPKGLVMPFEEKAFERIEEEMVVFITLRLLQNRLVAIGAVTRSVRDPECSTMN